MAISNEVKIIGAGIAGLSAAYILKNKGIAAHVFEASSRYGGLLDCFEVGGFRFDHAVHLSFADSEATRKIFDQTKYNIHSPDSRCFDEHLWIKHPVQNNLYPLATEEKIELIKGFVERPNIEVKNYKDWLIYQYGVPLANRYPLPYTKKYWTINAEEMGLDWIGKRMHRASLEEVLRGAMTEEVGNFYYTKEMRYPKKGGYRAFLNPLISDVTISYQHKLVKIDMVRKVMYFSNGHEESYNKIISTIPLPLLINYAENATLELKEIADRLIATRVDLISVGFSKPDMVKDLWFYIYDEDIWASRAYSPSIKSVDNCPEGTSSIQFEIYSSKRAPQAHTPEELKENCRYALKKMGIAQDEDIKFMDHRYINYGNVVFYDGMEKDRDILINWLKEHDVVCAGRFGEWDYLWSHQSMQSGFKAAACVAGEALV